MKIVIPSLRNYATRNYAKCVHECVTYDDEDVKDKKRLVATGGHSHDLHVSRCTDYRSVNQHRQYAITIHTRSRKLSKLPIPAPQ